MRRFKQLLPEDESLEILRDGSNAILALQGDEEYPYAVPVSYVLDGENIYIHSALAGHKIDCISYNPNVSLCVVKEDNVVPEEFTTYFKSVIVFGRASFITDKEEMIYGLRLLGDKYSPGIDSTDEIAKCLSRVAVIKIEIDSFTGKEAIELTRMRNK